MKIIACIKQVPASAISMNSSGMLNRSQSAGQLNPGDYCVLEAAQSIAECTGGSVTALTMGPESAEAVLRTAFSMGISRGILLSDRAFAGADVFATGYTLAQAIRNLSWDLVLCGQHSSDGDTAQLPFSLAAQLGVPGIGWVKSFQVTESRLLFQQELSGGTQEVQICGPCVAAVGQTAAVPRIPSLRNQLQAKNRPIIRMTLTDLADTNPAHYGLMASPTRVVSVRKTESISKYPPMEGTAVDAAGHILDRLREVSRE